MERTTPYKWREAHPELAEPFDAAVEDALAEGADWLREAARVRAVEGVEEPIYQQGRLVGTVRKYSDPLLQFLLRGAFPEVFRDRVEHSGSLGPTIDDILLACAEGAPGATE